MATVTKYVWVLVLVVGLAALSAGIVFAVQSQHVRGQIDDYLRAEVITLGIDEDLVIRGDVVDSADEAEVAQDIIREHRHGIALTYAELLAGERFDPINPDHLVWAQGMNLENSLGIARVGYGVSDMALASGVIMIMTGIALAGTGIALRKMR